MVDRKSITILVLLKESHIVGLVWTSPKTAQKSLEQGVLWHIHPSTNRELEYSPTIEIEKVVKREGWYEAELKPDQELHKNIEISFQALTPTSSFPPGTYDHKGNSTQDKNSSIRSNVTSFDFLSQLYDTIEERKRCATEGSYTRHLFESGEDKIRKKLGEEAIELLLAINRGDIVAECADLIYHLFVFLSEKDINPREVVEYLSNKAKE